MDARRALLAGCAAAVVVLLVGCTPTGRDVDVPVTVTVTPSTSTSTSASASASDSSPASAAPTGSPSSSSSGPTTAAVAGQCADDRLDVSVQADPEASGAGQRESFVVFRNTGSSPCVLQGAPGLSLVGGGNGTQIGQPAQRDTSAGPRVTIQAGGVALSSVVYSAVDRTGGAFGLTRCKPRPADGYRVYPPHSYRAFFSRTATYGCSEDLHWISVGLVEPAQKYPDFTPTS